MQSFQLTVFILSLLLCLSKGDDGNRFDDEDIDSDDDIRIIGGVPAGRVPYQASLRDSTGQHFCGGTIINNRTILTAAQCVQERIAESVVVGTNLLNYGGYSYDIQSSVIHPGYNGTTSANDIALLITEKDIIFNTNVQYISLPAQNSRLPDGIAMLATGWGSTDVSSPNYPNRLQALKTRKISLLRCQDYWNDLVLDTNICVFRDSRRGLCIGDSGGPVVAKNKIQGVTSFGVRCAVGAPDVLTRVASFVSWIKLNWVQ